MDTYGSLVEQFGREVVPLGDVSQALLGKSERQFIRTNERAGGVPPWPYFQMAKGTPRLCRLKDVAAALDKSAEGAVREMQAILA